MTELIVGVKHIRDDVETLPTFRSEMSVVGIIGTAEDADAQIFPLNTPVYLTTNDQAKIAELGADGTLLDAISGISAQLGVGQVAAKIVVVRVAEGVSVDTTIANIIGSEGAGTGIWALLDAGHLHGVVPRIVIVPGFTSQFRDKGVLSIAVGAAGTGYSNGTITIAAPPAGGVQATAHPVFTGGALTSIVIDNPGDGYVSAPSASFSGTGGSGASLGTVAVGVIGNPVMAAIPTVLDRLRAIHIPEGPSSTRQRWLDWLETISSARIVHPTAQGVLISDGEGGTITVGGSPRLAGIYVRRDYETDGVPSRGIANQAVRGIVGVSRPINWSYTDGSVEGQDLVGRHGGVIVKGESGVEDAVAEGGFVFWGTDTLSADPLWQFVNVLRMRDYIELGQVATLRYYLGRYNITTATVNAILNTVTSQLQGLKNRGYIIDFKVFFEADNNSPEDLRQGYLTIGFKAEEPPVLRKITVSSRRYREALTTLVNSIATQLGSYAG